jgi:hypothetical protein
MYIAITLCIHHAGLASLSSPPAGGSVQSNVQVQGSLARAVMVDSEVSTNSRTLHTLTVSCETAPMTIYPGQHWVSIILKVSIFSLQVSSVKSLSFFTRSERYSRSSFATL